MAISVANRLQNFSDTDATSYTTASITPTSGAAWVLFVYTSRGATAPPSLTITGCGLTWTSLGAIDFATDAGSGTHRRIEMFSGVGTPSTGTITIDAGGVTLNAAGWCLDEITGGDTTTPILSGSVVTNFNNTAGTSGSLTYASAADSNNRPIAAFAHGSSEGTTPRTNWTELNDVQPTNPGAGLETQYRSDTFETSGSATWTSSSKWGSIGGELKIVPLGTAYTESATTTVSLVGTTASEIAQYVESATGQLVVSASASDTGQLVDSGVATVSLSGSAVDTGQFVDSSTLQVSLSVSTSETHEIPDSATGTINLSTSASELREEFDTDTPQVSLSTSADEIRTIFDSGTGQVTISSTASDTTQFVDTGQGTVRLDSSATETYTTSGADSATATVLVSANESDQLAAIDSGSTSVVLSASAQDTAATVDSNSANVVLNVSAADAAQFADFSSALLQLSSVGVEVPTYLDAALGIVGLSASATQVFEAIDQAVVILVLSALGVERQVQGSIEYYLSLVSCATRWKVVSLFAQYRVASLRSAISE